MAILVSKSGGVISTGRPETNLETKRSCNALISVGCLSLVKTICFWLLKSALNVWKNSS